MDPLEFDALNDDDPFFGAYLKTKWAYKHVCNINTAIGETFFNVRGDLNRSVVDYDTGAVHEIEKLRSIHGVREDVYVWASYALHDLRAALDHVACAISSGAKREKAEFIIGDSLPEFEDVTAQRIKQGRLCVPSVTFMGAFNPYDGGNNLLYALHRLNIIDKHRSLLFIGAYKHERAKWDDTPVDVRSSVWEPLYEDKNVASAPIGKPYADTKILVQIAFGQVRAVEHQPIVSVLRDATALVEKIIGQARTGFPNASIPPI